MALIINFALFPFIVNHLTSLPSAGLATAHHLHSLSLYPANEDIMKEIGC